MKADLWDILKKYSALVALVAAITGWSVTYRNFRDYVDKDKKQDEKVNAFMANQNAINERSIVLYELYIHGRLPGAEEEGETAEARIPFRPGYDNEISRDSTDESGYYAFEATEDIEGTGQAYRGGQETEKGGY